MVDVNVMARIDLRGADLSAARLPAQWPVIALLAHPRLILRDEAGSPVLYLKGLSTSDFKSALAEFLGEGTMGLSPASIVKLKSPVRFRSACCRRFIPW